MASNKKKGLGRGIEALFAENEIDDDTAAVDETVVDIELDKIRPNPYQPRRKFDQSALEDLAASIKKSGVFQPIILRQPDKNLERYELIAGERRVRASELAGKKTIPAIVRNLGDDQMMEVAVLENLQREDLTPMEEAQAYRTLMDKLSLTQAELAKRLGKSRPYIANYLRLTTLPQPIQELLSNKQLSMGQARTIMGLKDKSKWVALAKQTVKNNLTVRQLEETVARENGTTKKPRRRKRRKPVYVRETESQLQSRFGTKVTVNESKKGRGKIEIPYRSTDDFNRILELLDVHFDN